MALKLFILFSVTTLELCIKKIANTIDMRLVKRKPKNAN